MSDGHFFTGREEDHGLVIEFMMDLEYDPREK